MRELAGLVREDGGSGIVNSGENVTNFVPFELLRVEVFKKDGFGFSGTDILASLVQMALRSFYSFGIVLLDVASGEKLT